MASDAREAEETPDVEELVQRLRAAREERREAESAVEEVGAKTLRELRDALRGLTGLLDQYEDSATGSGDFESYMKCRMEVQEYVEGLDDDLPERELFEDVAERFDARRLSQRDFDWAREHLEPVEELVQRLEARDAAEERRSDARRAVMARLDTVQGRLAELRDIQQLGEADLDAPVEEIRDPIQRYNESVAAAFETVRQDWPARRLLRLVRTTSAYPLVELRQPPDDLVEYVETHDAGMESVEQLLEYADYSRSKLDHYIDDPMALKRHVATHRTYLTRLDADPLQIEWPPAAAKVLRFRARELVAVVDRFAPEETVAALHDVRAATRRADFGTLRDTARARVELDEAERERLRSGEIEAELTRLAEERDTLESALDA
jgi:hypothetical protein